MPVTQANRIAHVAPARDQQLDILVPFTTLEQTQCALAAADALATAAHRRVRVIRLHEIPVYLTTDSTAIPLEHMRGEFLKLNAGHEFYGEVQLTRDSDQSWATLLESSSLVIIGANYRPWKTGPERLARRLARMGHKVVVVYGGK